jgi:flagellar hook-associated protein 2
MQTLIDKINDATSGFDSGARPATAALGPDGRIRLTDATGGASRLSLSLGVTHVDGTAGTLGATSVAIAGRSRELQQGKDAIIRVDGQEYTRSTNSITDAISGTTLALQTAEAGTTIDVSIDRDVAGGLATVQKFVDSYNAIRAFFDEQRKTDAPLYADTLLRGVVESFTSALRTEVTANGTYGRLAIAGVALDRFGVLKLDSDKLKTAMADKPTEIEALFGFTGVGGAFVTAADNATQYGIGTISAQMKYLDEAAIRLKSRETEAQKATRLSPGAAGAAVHQHGSRHQPTERAAQFTVGRHIRTSEQRQLMPILDSSTR